MRFRVVDQIVSLEPGQRIVTLKALSLAEEYLADHFPRFPVMPGVLMLEAMTEAGAWLLRATDHLAHSVVVLQQVRNLRLRSFVAPGEVLTVSARVIKREPHQSELEVEGTIGDRPAASGRLTLSHFNLADSQPALAATDEAIKRYLKAALSLLCAQSNTESTSRNSRRERQPSLTSV